jgi:hypothetical protein
MSTNSNIFSEIQITSIAPSIDKCIYPHQCIFLDVCQQHVTVSKIWLPTCRQKMLAYVPSSCTINLRATVYTTQISVQRSIQVVRTVLCEYNEGIRKEIQQRVATFFGRDSRRVLKVIVVNFSVTFNEKWLKLIKMDIEYIWHSP